MGSWHDLIILISAIITAIVSMNIIGARLVSAALMEKVESKLDSVDKTLKGYVSETTCMARENNIGTSLENLNGSMKLLDEKVDRIAESVGEISNRLTGVETEMRLSNGRSVRKT